MKWHTFTAIIAAVLVTAPVAGAVSYDQGTSYNGGSVMIRMSVPMGTVLNAGEELAFKFQTLQDAYVIVFNIDTNGYVHLLHPEQGMSMSAARRTYDVPEGRNSSLIVSGETGIEFVFALSVPSRDWVDEDELAYLFSLDEEADRSPYRIDGDPFLAANIIAAELVRGISRRPGVFLDFTYFYINERVAYPCYLCGECDRRNTDSDCERYQIVADFQRTQPLVYPLTRAYDLVDMGVAVNEEPADRTEVEFYPYRSEVYSYSRPYVYRVSDPYFYDPWYWDPWYSGWCYYPGAWPRSGWGWGWGVSVSVGWGWGCGSWGGYWCSPYYAPYDGGGGVQPRTSKFKTQYASGGRSFKSGTLVDGYRQSRSRDASSVIAARGTRSAGSTSAYRSARSGTSRSGQAAYKRTATYNRGGTTKVSGTRYDRTRAAYQKRTASRTGSRGGTVTRGGTTTRRQPQSVRRGTRTGNRSNTSYRRPSSNNRSRTGGTYRNPTSRSRSSVKSTQRKSGNRGSVRSAPRTSTRSRSAVKSSPRRSSNRSSVRSGGRSSPRSSSGARSGGSRSSGSRSGKRR